MKRLSGLSIAQAMAVPILMAATPAMADWTSWGRATQFYVVDAYADVMRVYHDLPGQANPAACASGGSYWIDIELNNADRSEFELQQMVNAIYMSMATSRNIRFLIDNDRCSPDGQRLATGVGLQNP